MTAARLVLKQAVVKEARDDRQEVVCAEGLSTVIFLTPEYRPIRLPAGDREVFSKLQTAAAAAGNGVH